MKSDEQCTGPLVAARHRLLVAAEGYVHEVWIKGPCIHGTCSVNDPQPVFDHDEVVMFSHEERYRTLKVREMHLLVPPGIWHSS